MELVDTQDLGSCAIMVCEFESHREYHKIHFSYFCIFFIVTTPTLLFTTPIIMNNLLLCQKWLSFGQVLKLAEEDALLRH